MTDIVDINVNKTVETVDINATPNVVQININTISGDVDFADQTEVTDGLVTDKTIAPNTLAGWWTYVKTLAQTFSEKITFTLGALFSPQEQPTHERGRVYFDDTNDCLSFMDSISGTSVQVGYEVLMRARNNTGTTIPNGSVVYISGAIGQNSTVALAKADTLPTSEIIGIATHDIANNTVGKICVFGLVNDFNTSSFTDGQMLYLSASVAGGLTSTIPASPNFVVALGVVEHAHPTQGKILVRPQRALANNNALGTAQNVPPTQNAVKSALDLKQNLLTNPITGTGTTNRISKFTASGTIGDSQIFDNGTNVGIGAESTSGRFTVRAQGALSTDIVFRVRNSTDTQNFLLVNGAGDVYNNGAGGVSTNTFFGQDVGRNATGFQNSLFGNFAGRGITTGNQNCLFGQSAGRQITTGIGNVVSGHNAFYNGNGISNVIFGNLAGFYISDGVTPLTTSNNSIFIGQETKALGNNQSNQIVIGHQAIGDGSNSVVLGNSSITRTRLQGQVIVGTFASAPTGIEGAIYYNSTDKKHYGFNGTTWNALY